MEIKNKNGCLSWCILKNSMICVLMKLPWWTALQFLARQVAFATRWFLHVKPWAPRALSGRLVSVPQSACALKYKCQKNKINKNIKIEINIKKHLNELSTYLSAQKKENKKHYNKHYPPHLWFLHHWTNHHYRFSRHHHFHDDGSSVGPRRKFQQPE